MAKKPQVGVKFNTHERHNVKFLQDYGKVKKDDVLTGVGRVLAFEYVKMKVAILVNEQGQQVDLKGRVLSDKDKNKALTFEGDVQAD